MSMERRWEDNDERRIWVFGDKPLSVPICTPQLLRRPARHRIRASGTRLWQGTAEELGRNTSACHKVQHKSHTDRPVIEPWGFAVKGRRLAAWPTARHSDLQKYESRPTFLSSTSWYPKQNSLVWIFPDFTPLVLLTTVVLIRRWVRSTGGRTWQGKPEVAHSEKKLGNANLSIKKPIRIEPGSNLGPPDERPWYRHWNLHFT